MPDDFAFGYAHKLVKLCCLGPILSLLQGEQQASERAYVWRLRLNLDFRRGGATSTKESILAPCLPGEGRRWAPILETKAHGCLIHQHLLGDPTALPLPAHRRRLEIDQTARRLLCCTLRPVSKTEPSWRKTYCWRVAPARIRTLDGIDAFSRSGSAVSGE